MIPKGRAVWWKEEKLKSGKRLFRLHDFYFLPISLIVIIKSGELY